MTILTNHAKKRIKERCGIGKSAAQRMSDHAIQRGYSRIQYSGIFRKWLDSYMREGQELYVYGDKVFVFTSADHVLITVLQIPQSLSRNAKKFKSISLAKA